MHEKAETKTFKFQANVFETNHDLIIKIMSFVSDFIKSSITKVYGVATFPYSLGKKDESFNENSIWDLHFGTKKVFPVFARINDDELTYASLRQVFCR